jgi:hypothetical protein
MSALKRLASGVQPSSWPPYFQRLAGDRVRPLTTIDNRISLDPPRQRVQQVHCTALILRNKLLGRCSSVVLVFECLRRSAASNSMAAAKVVSRGTGESAAGNRVIRNVKNRD